ncbi:hypothetical protein ABW19_dt0206672 [Dactylella cylindrospora]|nr:hypothetical protein ABW19_dt0206672 [Dactylella cylindrospora]
MVKRKHGEIANSDASISAFPSSSIVESREADSVSASPEPGPSNAVLPTRARPFIASQACDQCRLKKTKCDEDRPRCSTCVRNGFDCHYAEAKPTKKDQTISKIYSSIYRLEKKIEDVATLIRQQNVTPVDLATDDAVSLQIASVANPVERGPSSRLSIADVLNTSPDLKKSQMTSFINNNFFAPVPSSDTTPYFMQEAKQMSFSAHKILQWPAIQALLPMSLQGSDLIQDYATKLEAARPPLPFDIPSTKIGKHDWLQELPLSVIRGLTEAYFSTFNTSNPILDRGYFYTATLSVAVEGGFGYDVESCIVLVVLALGCLAVTAHKEANFQFFLPEGNFDSEDGQNDNAGFVEPSWMGLIEEGDGLPSGLRFFNEQRKRFGFLMCGTGLQYVQCHLLSG